MRRKLEKLLPSYAWLPLLITFAINMAVYYCTLLFGDGLYHHDITSRLDEAIPFLPGFVYIYVLAFAHWLIGYCTICREDRVFCYRMLSGEIIAKLICLVIFLAYPTTNVRPEVTAGGFTGWLMSLIYSVDKPVNLFPSIHCLDCWVCARGALAAKRPPKWFKIGMLSFALLVFCSVLFVKQHVLIDVPAGVLVAEVGQLAARKLDTGRVFARLEPPFARESGQL